MELEQQLTRTRDKPLPTVELEVQNTPSIYLNTTRKFWKAKELPTTNKYIIEELNGIKHYRKPTMIKDKVAYKPKSNNRNNWYFKDRTKMTCEIVYEAGQAYIKRMQDKFLRPRHGVKNPVRILKLFYYLYLTGSREQEAFKQIPDLEILKDDSGYYVKLSHINLKHKPPKNMVEATIPILCEHEKLMWETVTGMGQEDLSSTFNKQNWKSTAGNNLWNIFITGFHADMMTPDKKPKFNAGITPHHLRHARTFNWLIQHQVPSDLVQLWQGWDDKAMLSYYADIRSQLSQAEQLKMLKAANLIKDTYPLNLVKHFDFRNL